MAIGDIYASIDLGSNSFKIVTASEDESGLKIESCNEIASHGISRGVIIDTEKCYRKLSSFIFQLRKIHSFKVNLSSKLINGFCSSGGISVSGKISEKHITSAIFADKNYSLESQKNNIVLFYPYNFDINHTTAVTQPVGIKAKHLNVDYHLLSINREVVNNIHKIFEDTKYEVGDEIVSSISLGFMALTFDQKQKGICLLDIGSETCDLIVINNNSIKFSCVLEFGGIDFTKNIQYHYDCSFDEAENLKNNYGFINNNNHHNEDLIKFEQLGITKMLSNYQLAEVIEQSCVELLSQIKNALNNAMLGGALGSGFVMTGGCAKLDGLQEFSRKILRNKVTILNIDDEDFLNKGIYFKNKNQNNLKYYNALSLLIYKKDNKYLIPNVDINDKNPGFFGRIMKLVK